MNFPDELFASRVAGTHLLKYLPLSRSDLDGELAFDPVAQLAVGFEIFRPCDFIAGRAIAGEFVASIAEGVFEMLSHSEACCVHFIKFDAQVGTLPLREKGHKNNQ